MNRSVSIILKPAALIALSIPGIASVQANPFTLTGQCSLQTLPASQGSCTLSVSLIDANLANPSQVAKVAFRVNNKLTTTTVNDVLNPSTGIASSAAGGTFQVGCGSQYSVAAFVQDSGSTNFRQVGDLSAVICP